jgi:apolipoprotein N-acyltransferase
MTIGAIISRIALSLLTSAIWMLSFPDYDQGWLAWIALVPLIFACRNLNGIAAGVLGLLSGFASTWAVFSWIFEVPGFRIYHMAIGALYFGLYPALWCAGISFFRQSRIPSLFTIPALWVALDYLKAHAGFMAFPWGTLAQSQHSHLSILQIAAFTGEYGPTFLMVMTSVVLTELIISRQRAWKKAIMAGIIIGLAGLWGVLTLSRPMVSTPLRVAVIQPSILLSERGSPAGYASTINRMEMLTLKAAQAHPALIAWPETAVRDLAKDPNLILRLRRLSDTIQTPLIVGASDYTKFNDPGKAVFEARQYNSAYFIEPGKPPGAPYRKKILVPFGEYLPWESLITWPTWLIPRSFNVVPGDESKIFQLTDGTRFSVIICWENLFSSYVRQIIKGGAQLVVHLSNDNWFGPTAAPHQHNLASVLRAVENRTPILIASNTGPSEIIDPYGRIKARQPGLFTQGIVGAEIKLSTSQKTFYTRHGDLFAWGAIVFACIGFIESLLIPKKRKGL